MGQWAHGSGFSVDASVRIEANDRAGRERLLRYDRRKSPFGTTESLLWCRHRAKRMFMPRTNASENRPE